MWRLGFMIDLARVVTPVNFHITYILFLVVFSGIDASRVWSVFTRAEAGIRMAELALLSGLVDIQILMSRGCVATVITVLQVYEG